jgi:transposase
MEVIVDRVAGLDVHKKQVTACVRAPGATGARTEQVRQFPTFTEGLRQLREWLLTAGVTVVAMEATGVYWKPIYWALEDGVFELLLVNARSIKQAPGRKTDVIDAAWIAQLAECGLLRGSFVPPPEIRRLRDLTRYRKRLIQDRAREVLRVQKLLEDAGIKLSSVASDTLGVSGRAILEALVAGSRDPQVLAELARGRLRAKLPLLRMALEGRFDTHHAVVLADVLAHLDYLDEAISRLGQEVDAAAAPVAGHIERLCTIPGVGKLVAETILAEIGADMTRFPSAAHLASWAGMCPNNNESAGRRRSARTRKGSPWLRAALAEAGWAASHTRDCYLASQFWRLRGRRGPGKATIAVGHSILVIAYHVLLTGQSYRELGGDYFLQRQNPDVQRRRLVAQLERLGYAVTLQPAAAT